MIKGILVVGASGLLGSNWIAFAQKQYVVIGATNKRAPIAPDFITYFLDARNLKQTESIINNAGVDLVINCAGLTNIEYCETNRAEAYRCNVVIPRNLATCCAHQSIKFVHISTDHVFSGFEGGYKETDHPTPLNVYATTKVQAETEVLQVNPTALVLRVNFFGWGPAYRKSFSDTIISSLRCGHEISLFTDAFFSPMLTETVVQICHNLVDSGASGIYHVTNNSCISKYDFGLALAEVFGLQRSLIRPALLHTRKDLVTRPLNISLKSEKLRKVLGYAICDLEPQLKRLLELEK